MSAQPARVRPNEREKDFAMACISKALIVGGGIAGLSCAIALSRTGAQCDVVETGNSWGGASIGITGRAADALAELGIYEECFAASTPFPRDSTVASQFDAAGRLVSPGPVRPDWPGSKVGLGVYRAALLKSLADAAKRAGASIRIGVTAKAIEEQASGVLVRFSDQTQGNYELVIGADGINSSVRALAFPDAPKPAYSGQFSMRWMVEGDPVSAEGWYTSPVGRLGFYNLPKGVTYVAAVFNIAEFRWLDKTEVHSLFTALLDSFTAPAIVELRSRLKPDAEVIARPFEWLLVPDSWARGRTLLIGDAAHATTAHLGMGGGMALEDSVVLGQCMATSPTLDEALSRFMARRYARVRTVVETSLALSQLEQRCALRSEAVGVMKVALATISESY
jgi:2-polyprenyl-6-methoxyphenol hydroxylase-like FAD-dependent oxidoreductase